MTEETNELRRIVKSPEDMTNDEIKIQLALYQRLYYHRTKDDPDVIARKKAKNKRHYAKKLAEKNANSEGTSSEEPPPKPDRRKYKIDVKEAYILA